MGAPLATEGTVVSSSGRGAPEGATCRVAIVNEGRGRYVCRAEVQCGEQVLYGTPMLGGYTNCEARDGVWARVWDHTFPDEDGDPWMDYDVAAGTLVVRTRDAETEVRVGG